MDSFRPNKSAHGENKESHKDSDSRARKTADSLGKHCSDESSPGSSEIPVKVSRKSEEDELLGSDDEDDVDVESDDELADVICKLSVEQNDDTDESTQTQIEVPEDQDITDVHQELMLRSYQEELVKEAKTGKNCLIVAPTGTGKTFVAISIIKDHLESTIAGEVRKVVFFVPTQILVNQQFRKLRQYISCRVEKLSGEHDIKQSMADLVRDKDLLVMTPQTLLNALESKDIQSLAEFSLLVFDECHSAVGEYPYNKIMARFYVEEKLKKTDLSNRLPQVVGLTASPGAGAAHNISQVQEHILQLCANMDATEICTVHKERDELLKYAQEAREDVAEVTRRARDPFRDSILKVMKEIERHIETNVGRPEVHKGLLSVVPNIDELCRPPDERGSQKYAQFVSKLRQETIKSEDRTTRCLIVTCLRHLKIYNHALVINEDCRMKDAMEYIRKDFDVRNPLRSRNQTHRWLHQLYTEKLMNIRGKIAETENPKLVKLMEKILEFDSLSSESQGIVFCQTRAMTEALVAWMKETPLLTHLNAHQVIGSGRTASQKSTAMTRKQLDDTLELFSQGECKVIVATTVVEEGLDVKQCNYVICYEYVPNDIARVQARGRARATNARYLVLAERGRGIIEQDETNKAREKMMNSAIDVLLGTPADDIRKKVHELQSSAKSKRDLSAVSRQRTDAVRQARNVDEQYQLRCLQCEHFFANNSDIRTYKQMHHVVINDTFEAAIRLAPHFKRIDTWEQTHEIFCQNCGLEVGIKAKFSGATFSVLQAKTLLIVGPSGQRMNKKKWKDIPFAVPELSAEEIERMLLTEGQQLQQQ